jgi:hypothetical protein
VKLRIVWYAAGLCIVRSGPYRTQVEAVHAMRLVGSTDEMPIYPHDMRTWPEAMR